MKQGGQILRRLARSSPSKGQKTLLSEVPAIAQQSRCTPQCSLHSTAESHAQALVLPEIAPSSFTGDSDCKH